MQTRLTKTRGKRRSSHGSGRTLDDLVDSERQMFARKVRGARAVLGWSQIELARRAGLTQTSIHRIEQGATDLKHSTVVVLEKLFVTVGITFETPSEGSFKIVFSAE